MSNVAYYRVYDLPWTPTEDEQRRLRRILGSVLGIFLGFGIVIPLLPERPRVQAQAPAVPDRIVEFILERPKPEPEPVLELPPPKPEPVQSVEPRPEPQPLAPAVAVPPRADPREKAAASGILALADELEALRERKVSSNVEAVNAAVGERAKVNRSLLTSGLGEGSGGIAVSDSSSGFGAERAALEGHATVQVAPAAPVANGAAERSGRSSQASRTREEIELVFDRNKSAIYSIYSRALRENPALQGKVVLELTIAPSGDVSSCRIVSSELGDAELERKLVARVKMFRFERKDVAPMTTTKPIEFFPA
jgi:TonB family protein